MTCGCVPLHLAVTYRCHSRMQAVRKVKRQYERGFFGHTYLLQFFQLLLAVKKLAR